MRATFLGTGTSTGVPVLGCPCAVCASSDPRDRRLRPSVLVEWAGATVLVDASVDFREQGIRVGLRRLDAVLLTHAHADHVFGLDEMRQFNWRQGSAVPVFGSRETLAAVRRTFWYAFDEVQGGGGTPRLDLREVEGPFGLLGRTVVPVPLLHGDLAILGYRIGRLAYLTDASRIPDASRALLAGLDVLVLNALRPRPHPTHFSLAEAIAEARAIGARRTLFTHMGHEMPHETTNAALPRGVELAWDGLVVEIEENEAG